MNSPTIYSELERMNDMLFKVCGLELTDIQPEKESKEYSAMNFKLSGQNVKFRKAKITPTKTGQFVTLWKRNKDGITQPFDSSDDFDFYLILTQKETNSGLFIFPKAILIEYKVLSDKTNDGKRGIRVYPAWDLTTNKQAQKTQSWQTKYFLELSQNEKIDTNKAGKLFHR